MNKEKKVKLMVNLTFKEVKTVSEKKITFI